MAQPPKSRVEIRSIGFDPSSQFVVTDPYGGSATFTCQVPTLATTSLPSCTPPSLGTNSRYLFKLASFQVGQSGGCARIRGYRLQVELWAKQTSEGAGTRYVRQTVLDPAFTLSDANWSWHLRYIPATALEAIRGGASQNVPPTAVNGDGTTIDVNVDGVSFRWADTSVLLYEALQMAPNDLSYVDLVDYTPPNRGIPWGEPIGNLGTFYGVTTPYSTSHAWDSLDIPCSAPGTYALYCSVKQTNASTRLALTGFTPSTIFSQGLSDEEQFLLNFPTAYIGAVGGSLIVEYDTDECDSTDGVGMKEGPCG